MDDEECEIFVAYFGTIEIRRDVTKSRIIMRNYLLQRITQFQIDDVFVEIERMRGSVNCNNGQIPELAHCELQQTRKGMKSNFSKIEDFLICATNRSCFLARNTANNESSLYRIFTDNKINDFQLLQFGSAECIRELSAVVVQVACGAWHSIALTDHGDVYLWGWNKCGQLGNCCEIGEILDIPVPLDIDENVVDIAAHGNSTWLRRVDQSVLTLARKDYEMKIVA
ncbi:Regulator of chromosome condensation (RCC1) repeat family protein [Acanthocheilonema viteae]